MRKSNRELALSEDDFITYLSENGVEVEHKSSKRKGDFIKYRIRDEFIYRKDADNSKAVVMAPKTNNASIGDEKLSKWADADMGYSGIQAAIARNVANAPVPVKAPVTVQPVEVAPVVVSETQSVADTVSEPVIKHHKPAEEPVQKTPEELEREKDARLKSQFNILAGIDIFKDHTSWTLRDDYEELLAESDRRWMQFKEWYPDDYEERIQNKDISSPKTEETPEMEPSQADITPASEEIPVSEPVKSHTEDVSEFKKHKQDAVQKAKMAGEPDKTLIRKQSEDERKINQILADAEELDIKKAQKDAEDETDEWGRPKK